MLRLAASALIVILIVVAATTSAASPRRMKIINVMMENRAFDHLLGHSAKALNIDGLTGKEFNPVSTMDPDSPKVFVQPNAPNRASFDPDHAEYAYTDKIFGLKNILSKNYKETMMGFVEWETVKRKHPNNNTIASVMGGFTNTTLPILNQLAAEFSIFDKFFAGCPGPTWPNRIIAMAAATGPKDGVQNTETFFWQNGIPGELYTMPTIFDQLVDAGLDWQLIYEDVPWENFMSVIARSPSRSRQLGSLYQQLASCNSFEDCQLPAYTFVNPRGGINVTTGAGANDFHPDHLATLAEQFYRDIYTAVRASPLWQSGELTLIISFDEGGGFYDHVPPPMDIPAPWAGPHKAFPDWYFDFKRLGARIPLLVINPLVPRGTVVSEPPAAQKPANNSAYDHSSILNTIRKWTGIPNTPLTQRDAWSASFEHVLSLDTPRTDCPKELRPIYSGPDVASREEEARIEAEMPISGLQKEMLQITHQLTDGHPLRTTPHPSTLTKQGHVSEWLQKTYNEHRLFHELRQRGIRQAVENVELVVGPSLTPIWAGGDIKFETVNGSKCGQPHRWTISTKSMRDKHHSGAPLCIRHNTTSGAIDLTPCYPSADPCKNHDETAWWNVMGDASVRPLSAPQLAMTSPMEPSKNGSPVYLAPRKAELGFLQSWGFNLGGGAANAEPGEIMMGDGVNILGVKLKIF